MIQSYLLSGEIPYLIIGWMNKWEPESNDYICGWERHKNEVEVDYSKGKFQLPFDLGELHVLGGLDLTSYSLRGKFAYFAVFCIPNILLTRLHVFRRPHS